MKGMEIAKFDKSEVYETEVEPLMQELLKVCNINRIPLFACAAIRSSKDDTEFKAIALNPAQYGYSLKVNKFSDFTNIMNGAETYYKDASNAETNAEYEELLALMDEGENRRRKKGTTDGE